MFQPPLSTRRQLAVPPTPSSGAPAPYHNSGGGEGGSLSGTLEVRVIEATDLVERRKERRTRGFFGGASLSLAEAVGGGAGAEYAWPYVTIRAGPGPAKRSTPSALAVAGAEATSGVVPWQEDFVFEGVRTSEQVTVTCYLHRRSLAPAAGGDGFGPGGPSSSSSGASSLSSSSSSSSIVGEVHIPLGRLPEGHPVEQWYQLLPRGEAASAAAGGSSSSSKAAIKLRLFYQVRDETLAAAAVAAAMVGEGGGRAPGVPPTPSSGGLLLGATLNLNLGLTQALKEQRQGQGQPEEEGDEAGGRGESGGDGPVPPPALGATGLLLGESSSDLDGGGGGGAAGTMGPPLPTPSSVADLAQEELPTGLVDYFCVLGPRVDEATGLPNLANGSILVRHPPEDKAEMPLPESPHFFCFPAGMALAYGAGPPQPEPLAYTFVIKHSGVSSYGVCLHFHRRWERLSQDQALSLGGGQQPSGSITVWAPVCLCLLTRVPVVLPLQEWLVQAYDRMDDLLPPTYDDLLLDHETVPRLSALLRAHIVQLTMEVPLPIPGALGVKFDFLGRPITLRLPGPGALPALNYPLAPFLHTFSPRNVLALVAAALTESKILFHSRDLALLPSMAESLLALLYPLQWQHPYLVPLPKELMVVIETPTNYILGVHTDWLPAVPRDSLKDVVLVDCDSGAVRLPPRPFCPPSFPPAVLEPLLRRLRATVHPGLDRLDSARWGAARGGLHNPDAFRATRISPVAEQELRTLLVRCMAYLLSGYQDCIFYLDPSSPIFNRSRFMAEYAPPEEQPFLARLFDTQSFQAFLETQEGPHIDLFRRVLHRAFSRATSRPASPIPSMGASSHAPGAGQHGTLGSSKKNAADFQISAEESGNEWLEDLTGELGLMSPGGGPGIGSPVGVASPGGVGDAAMRSAASYFGSSAQEADASVKLMLTVPPPPLDDESEEEEEDDEEVGTDRSGSLAGSASGSAVAEEGEPSVPAGVRFASAPGRGRGCSVDEAGSSGGSGSSPRRRGASWSPSKRRRGRQGAAGQRKSSKPLALSVLVASPTKGARSGSLGLGNGAEEFEEELDALMRKTMNLNSVGSGGSGSASTPRDGAGAAAAVLEGEEQAGRADEAPVGPECEWREARRWTVEEAAGMMGVTVREMARALGLNFDLQRVMTRGHTLFGFTGGDAGATGNGLDGSAGTLGSPHGLLDGGGKDGGALSEEAARLHRCLMEAFSTEQPSKELLQEVEGAFRLKAVRTRFIAILSQPRGGGGRRRGPRHHHYVHGGPGAGSAGQFRVHSTGFEALMQLASAACTACQADGEHLTAHALLQLMGKYYRVLEGQGPQGTGWPNGLRAAEGAGPAKEFLSSRLRHHQVFQSVDLWLMVLKEQMDSEQAGDGAGGSDGGKEAGHAGFKLAQAPAPKGMDRSPGGSGGSSTGATASTPVATGGGQPEDGSSVATAAEAQAEAEAEARKFVHRVRAILLEMHGVGMPDQKALAFVGRACEMNRAGPQSRQALVKLTQRVWRISAAPPQHQQIPRPPLSSSSSSSSGPDAADGGGGGGAAAGGGGGGSSAAAVAAAALARRHVSFKGIGSDDTVSSKDGGELVSPIVPGSHAPPQQQPARSGSPYYPRSTSPIAQLMGYGAGGGSSGSSSSSSAAGGAGETTTHKGPVLCLDVDPQGSLGVSGGADKLLVVYSILQRCRITTYSGHMGPVTCARILRDKGGEPLVASASLDSTLRIWKLGTGPASVSSHPAAPALPPLLASFTTARDVRGVLTGHSRGIVSMDASEELQLLATGAMDRVIKLWNLTQSRNTATLVGHTGTVASVKLLDQAQAYRILSGSSDRTMALWDSGRGTCLRVFRGHESWVRQVEGWGRDLAVTASNDRSLRVWDLRVHNCVHKLSGHQGAVTCLQVSGEQDAPLLFSGSTDATVRVWDLRAGGRCTAVLEGHSEAVTALALQQAPGSDSVRKLVSGGEDKRLVEWDARSGALLQSRMGHRDGISCLQVTRRNTVVTGSYDCSVRVWEGCSVAP